MNDTNLTEDNLTTVKPMVEQSEFYDQAILAEKIITEKVNEAIKSNKAHRRWFWELLQNAKDTVINETDRQVAIKLTYTRADNGELVLTFEHSGNPFKYNPDRTRFDDLKNLILPVSGKPPGKASGKFGTGFLSTHILSLKFNVKGVYQDESNDYWEFSIDIDRKETDREKRIESIVKSLTEKKSSFKKISDNYSPSKEEFRTTKFTYFLSCNEHGIKEGTKIVQEGLKDILQVLPYVLNFIPEIDTVEIIDTETAKTKTKFSKLKPENIGELKIATISKSVSTLDNSPIANDKILISSLSDNFVEIAIQIFSEGNIFRVSDFNEQYKKETGKDFPTLFSSFPLIGSEDFKFPLVINSTGFNPNERRDGVELKTNLDGNQTLIDKAVTLYMKFLDIASKDWKDIYILAKTDNSIPANHDWISKKWFEEGSNEFQGVLKPIRKKILNTAIVDVLTKDGTIERKTIKATNDNNQIFFPLKDNKEKLYEFGKETFPNSLPVLSDIENWCSVIGNEKDFTRVTTEFIIEGIASKNSVDVLAEHIYRDKAKTDETLTWLYDFYSFIKTDFKDKTATLFNHTVKNIPQRFIPDRELKFWLLNDLKKDIGYKSKDEYENEVFIDIIDDTLLLIHKEITGDNLKSKLLHGKYSDFLQTKEKISEEQVATSIRDAVDDKLRKEKYFSPEFKNTISKLYDWISIGENNVKDYFGEAIKNKILSAIIPSDKIKYVTTILELDRNKVISLERQVAILSDPELETKLFIGEIILRNKKEFEERARRGKLFEDYFHLLMAQDNRYSTEKKDGEQDFIVTNIATSHKYFVEIKSIGALENEIRMTEKQVKKAKQNPDNYFLCVIQETDNPTEEYFRMNAKFNGEIGKKLFSKVSKAEEFETPEPELEVEFEDELLQSYQRYRYKFRIGQLLWGQENFDTFKSRLT
ncbi:MAG: DUF3883 domain-containing protein [Ignavibacteria bacterium]